MPLDGVVVWGAANVSLAHISGESQPVRMAPGSEVPAGSLATDGTLVLRVTASAEDSTPARIARMAAEAQVPRGGGAGVGAGNAGVLQEGWGVAGARWGVLFRD